MANDQAMLTSPFLSPQREQKRTAPWDLPGAMGWEGYGETEQRLSEGNPRIEIPQSFPLGTIPFMEGGKRIAKLATSTAGETLSVIKDTLLGDIIGLNLSPEASQPQTKQEFQTEQQTAAHQEAYRQFRKKSEQTEATVTQTSEAKEQERIVKGLSELGITPTEEQVNVLTGTQAGYRRSGGKFSAHDLTVARAAALGQQREAKEQVAESQGPAFGVETGPKNTDPNKWNENGATTNAG